MVAVLTNARTYSSARMMAAWVQDGGFGVVIGEPSSNAPTAFGNMIGLTLPHSRINLSVSFTLWLRPDSNADQTTIWPDTQINHHQALEAALVFFKER